MIEGRDDLMDEAGDDVSLQTLFSTLWSYRRTMLLALGVTVIALFVAVSRPVRLGACRARLDPRLPADVRWRRARRIPEWHKVQQCRNRLLTGAHRGVSGPTI